jgi:hypothetical protein
LPFGRECREFEEERVGENSEKKKSRERGKSIRKWEDEKKIEGKGRERRKYEKERKGGKCENRRNRESERKLKNQYEKKIWTRGTGVEKNLRKKEGGRREFSERRRRRGESSQKEGEGSKLCAEVFNVCGFCEVAGGGLMV